MRRHGARSLQPVHHPLHISLFFPQRIQLHQVPSLVKACYCISVEAIARMSLYEEEALDFGEDDDGVSD